MFPQQARHHRELRSRAFPSCPKIRAEPRDRILEALSKFAETRRRGTGSAIRRSRAEALLQTIRCVQLVRRNSCQHRDEQRARADLEALVDTSPMGVVVFDARTGKVVSLNREAKRIVGDLRTPGRSVE